MQCQLEHFKRPVAVKKTYFSQRLHGKFFGIDVDLGVAIQSRWVGIVAEIFHTPELIWSKKLFFFTPIASSTRINAILHRFVRVPTVSGRQETL